jgi:hypothetical protein
MAETAYCDFEFLREVNSTDTEYRCTVCKRTLVVIGDREPPNDKVCRATKQQREAADRPEKSTPRDILLNAIARISEKHHDVYLIWFGTTKHYFATWSPKSGFKFDSDAAKHFEALRTVENGQRVYKIPYLVGFDSDKSENSEHVTTVSE